MATAKRDAQRPPQDSLRIITSPNAKAKDAVRCLQLMESDLNESAAMLELAAEAGDQVLVQETLDELDDAVYANHVLCLAKPEKLEIDALIAETQLALAQAHFEDPGLEAIVKASVAKAVSERTMSSFEDAAVSFRAARELLVTTGKEDDDADDREAVHK